jgi:curli biogenesis system outer membrane secretion channel CsgG
MRSFTAVIALAAIASVTAQDSNSSECTAESLTAARNACDSIADVSQLKCDNEACHEALHSLTEDEVRASATSTWVSARSPTSTTTSSSMSFVTEMEPTRPT